MKVEVRLIGDGFTRADVLVNSVRRRALERLEARIAVNESARAGRTPRTVEASPQSQKNPPR